ncbi:hypothetical protein [Nocardiopsis trehalosi]|uniref:hypothetical protein n=1 Tax=Nocardiopsis trehalosi TaxID=109329 RepID=UPI00083142AC|nr:hypothetical protein [Nocardiopsis trehalosi]
MTVWTWLAGTARAIRDAGDPELADLVARLPVLAVDGDVARLAAALPALRRAARADDAPAWLPVFAEHWPVAARVGDRAEGTAALPDALALLRAAHPGGGAAPACPPGFCAAEAVLACYAAIDGPGHAVDRAALLTEARAHVRADHPAHLNLALAHADTLVDDDRPDEAVAELDRRAAESRAAGGTVPLEYAFGYVRALRHQDRHAEALSVVERVEAAPPSAWPGGAVRAAVRRRARVERARLLAWMARTGGRPVAEAAGALPDVREPDAHPALRVAWADAAEHLAAQGALANDWRLGVALTTWSRYSERVGAHRTCLELSLAGARLAAARGARWVADAALLRAGRALGRVRRADEAAADLAEARASARRVPLVEPPAPPDRLLDLLRAEPPERVDPERQADLVVDALPHRPDDSALLNALGQVGRTLMLTDSAAEQQWRHVRRAPGDQKAALALLETLLHDNDTAGVRTLVRTLTDAAVAARAPA